MVNELASACQARAFSSNQVNERASSGIVTRRVSPGWELHAGKALQLLHRARHRGMIFSHV